MKDEIDKETYDLLLAIHIGQVIHSNTILKWDNECIYSFYKGRYAVCCQGGKRTNSITIVDCWTGKTK